MFKLINKNKNKEFVILQLTDVQIIDPKQKCYPDRIHGECETIWLDKDKCAFNLMKQLVDKVKPDWIVVTGDNVYGEFDKSGNSFIEFVRVMESFKTPWSFVFGNHDGEVNVTYNNITYEAGIGYKWQCDYIKNNTKYCLFTPGKPSMGYSNYFVELVDKEDNPLWTFAMLDTHGCRDGETQGINDEQIEFYKNYINDTNSKYNKKIKNFIFYHIPSHQYRLAALKYYGDEKCFISSDGSKNERGDFGQNQEPVCCFQDDKFWNTIKELDTTVAIFAGHDHINNSSIMYEGIRLTFGMKTGTYDYHNQLGGTKITIKDNDYNIEHIIM